MAPVDHGTVVVFDEASDSQDTQILSDLAKVLSSSLNSTILAVLNHDDDVLWYRLYVGGFLQDEYDSAPGYFEGAEPSAPTTGDAQKLCTAFESSAIASVEEILRKSAFEKDGYAFQFQRHADLVGALGISPFGVGTAYASFDDDELPEGLSKENVLRTY